MSVLVDTPIWSLALRKTKTKSVSEIEVISKLAELIEQSLTRMIGPIRQEILSGISSPAAFTLLREKLEAWNDIVIDSSDYTRAAEMYNICRKRGIQGSHIDFLICAVAEKHDLSIYTLDKDFLSYAKYLPIQLFDNV